MSENEIFTRAVSACTDFSCELSRHVLNTSTFFDENLLEMIAKALNSKSTWFSIWDKNNLVGATAINRSLYLRDQWLDGVAKKDLLSQQITEDLINHIENHHVSTLKDISLERQRSEEYREYDMFLKSVGIKYVAVIPINNSFRLEVHRCDDEGDFSTYDIELIEAIQRMLISHYKVFLRINSTTKFENISDEFFSKIQIGTITRINKSPNVEFNKYMIRVCRELFGVDTQMGYYARLQEILGDKTSVEYEGYEVSCLKENMFTYTGGVLDYNIIFMQKLSVSSKQVDQYMQSVNHILPLETLSAREMEVIDYFTRGDSWAEIGEKLFISEGTVKMHLKNAYKKLGINNQRELAFKYGNVIAAREILKPKE